MYSLIQSQEVLYRYVVWFKKRWTFYTFLYKNKLSWEGILFDVASLQENVFFDKVKNLLSVCTKCKFFGTNTRKVVYIYSLGCIAYINYSSWDVKRRNLES